MKRKGGNEEKEKKMKVGEKKIKEEKKEMKS